MMNDNAAAVQWPSLGSPSMTRTEEVPWSRTAQQDDKSMQLELHSRRLSIGRPSPLHRSRWCLAGQPLNVLYANPVVHPTPLATVSPLLRPCVLCSVFYFSFLLCPAFITPLGNWFSFPSLRLAYRLHYTSNEVLI